MAPVSRAAYSRTVKPIHVRQHAMRYDSILPLFVTLACTQSAPGSTPAGRPLVDTTFVLLNPTRKDTGQVLASSAVDSGPTIIHCPSPVYPDTLRQARIQGRVMLELVIDTLGRPEQGSVRALTSPHHSLSSAAVTAMRACQFTPARLGGRAVRVLVQIPIDFTINGP